jgi:hypothetical protein
MRGLNWIGLLMMIVGLVLLEGFLMAATFELNVLLGMVGGAYFIVAIALFMWPASSDQ